MYISKKVCYNNTIINKQTKRGSEKELNKMKKNTAHRIGESKYSYRGWQIVYDYEAKIWLPIDPNGDTDFSGKTLKEVKESIDGCIKFQDELDLCDIVCR